MININVKEIYLLNLALGGSQIFSFPNFSDIKITNLLADTLMDSLIEKNILIDYKTFSKEGINIMTRIDDFKKSSKYIKLGSFVFGISENDTTVLLKRNFRGDRFSFERIDMTDAVSKLVTKYPFLNSDNSAEINSHSDNITYDELLNTFELNEDNSIYLSTFIVKDSKITDEIIFYADNKLYLYDRKNLILEQKSCLEIKSTLNERLVL